MPAHRASRALPAIPHAAVFGAFSLLRLVLLPTFELLPQSAYYFTAYAEHPALSYYDHPPMIGWLLWLGAAALGRSALAVHLTVFFTTLGTQAAFWVLARRVYAGQAGGGPPPTPADPSARFTRSGQWTELGGPPPAPAEAELGRFRRLGVGAEVGGTPAAPAESELGGPPPAPAEAELGRFGRSGSTALVLLASTALATLVSLIAVPDVPLLLFWTLALLALHRALFGRGPSPRAGAWLAAGVLMGLALLSKYTALFLQGGLVLFLLLSPEHRRWLRSPWPWTALAVAHAVASPVYLWNARHGFASLLFQTAGRASEAGFAPENLLGFLAAQAAVLLPVAFIAFLAATGRGLRSLAGAPSAEPRTLFLLAFSAPLFLTCAALSPWLWVKVNWAFPAYVSGLILAASAVGPRALRWQLAASAVLHAAIAVQLVWYPVPVRSDETWFGWRELAARVEERSAAYPEAFVFSGDGYRTTAELRFYSDLPVYGMNVIGWNALQYAYLGEDLAALAGRDALFLSSEPKLRASARTARYLERVRDYFASVEELEPIEIRHRDEVARLFRVFLCRGYLGPHGDV